MTMFPGFRARRTLLAISVLSVVARLAVTAPAQGSTFGKAYRNHEEGRVPGMQPGIRVHELRLAVSPTSPRTTLKCRARRYFMTMARGWLVSWALPGASTETRFTC